LAGPGFYPGTWGGLRSWDYFPYGRFDYGLNYFYTAPTTHSYSAYYPEPVEDPMLGQLGDDAAHLSVWLPAGAELWFDGVRTRQLGEQRRFVSPPLAPGRDYTYEVRARWNEDGRAVDRVQRVHVRANTWAQVDMMRVP
jgi:uncharacterized protein (TIGR03000 family)